MNWAILKDQVGGKVTPRRRQRRQPTEFGTLRSRAAGSADRGEADGRAEEPSAADGGPAEGAEEGAAAAAPDEWPEACGWPEERRTGHRRVLGAARRPVPAGMCGGMVRIGESGSGGNSHIAMAR
jgi:hypothetical protein